MPIGRLRALIVDDEKAIRRFLRSTLIAEDFDVADAETCLVTGGVPPASSALILRRAS